MENRVMEQLKTIITREDILDGPVYEEQREEERERIWEIKNNRRLSVGPHATFYFESYDTMLYQIHEMVRIEKGGEEQIRDELEAYNSLVPNGKEFVATLMFEINVSADKGYAWAFPSKGNLLNIGIGVPVSIFKKDMKP